jgi:hypothetical protein
MARLHAPPVKRLVDLVDRGPEDDAFFPAASNETIFRRTWPSYHNVVQEIVELGYQGNAAWGQRITIPLKRMESGDLLSWLCLRLQPRTWLGADLESKLVDGAWDYADPSGAWMWAASLGSIAIQQVELEIGDTTIEKWPGEWMDVWSRCWMDGGRAAVWDSDIYGQLPCWEIRDSTRPPWTTVLPTEDGYVYCWLPLTFLRRPQTAFPLVAMGEQQEIRVHVTLRPFHEVIRQRAQPIPEYGATPLGSKIVLLDKSGPTPVPWEFVLPSQIPGFEDATVFAGVVHTENPLREAYMRVPIEMLYERVVHMRFDVPDKITGPEPCRNVQMSCPLLDFNGPIRELCWFVRRKAVWRHNEWTNYGRLLEEALVATIDPDSVNDRPTPIQEPLMKRARLLVDNAVWRDESEEWWRLEYGLAHRGGVRVALGYVYGFALGDAAGLRGDELQPAGTINASRSRMKLELTIEPPSPAASACGESETSWEVHVFGIGLNWLRFVNGMAVPLFQD